LDGAWGVAVGNRIKLVALEVQVRDIGLTRGFLISYTILYQFYIVDDVPGDNVHKQTWKISAREIRVLGRLQPENSGFSVALFCVPCF
jgi:hypothetical protein